MPWQSYLARIVYALAQGDTLLYPEVAAIVSRQNGKTTFIVPHILTRLEQGRRILHAAQLRNLPRKTFDTLAPIVREKWPNAKIRYAQGQEEIILPEGGYYTITAAQGKSPRGLAAIDDLIIDELREIGEEFVGAALPTMLASPNPQVLYLSNAGTETSRALNSVRARADMDPSLAYLEWSAAPGRAVDDVEGWAEANPAMGHSLSIGAIDRNYRSAKAAGTLPNFETEHLCRWVPTMRERLVDDFSWIRCAADPQAPVRPVLAVSMDPKGRRVSAALAWQDGEDVRLTLVLNEIGDPIDTDVIGKRIKQLAEQYKVRGIAFDPLTDAELVKYVKAPKPEPIAGQKFANASAQFRNGVDAQRIRWHDADPVTEDLTWTAMKPNGEGAYHAVRAIDDRPITASLAAIRAVWLASGPPTPTARVWT